MNIIEALNKMKVGYHLFYREDLYESCRAEFDIVTRKMVFHINDIEGGKTVYDWTTKEFICSLPTDELQSNNWFIKRTIPAETIEIDLNSAQVTYHITDLEDNITNVTIKTRMNILNWQKMSQCIGSTHPIKDTKIKIVVERQEQEEIIK